MAKENTFPCWIRKYLHISVWLYWEQGVGLWIQTRKRGNFPGLLQDWHFTWVISPTPSNVVVLIGSHAPQAPLPCRLSLPSSQSQDSLPLWVPSILSYAFHLARQPEMLLPSCWLAEASVFKRVQRGGSCALYPPLLFPKRFRLLNSTVSVENQEGGLSAMSEISILVWVQACWEWLLLIIPGESVFEKSSAQYLWVVWDKKTWSG